MDPILESGGSVDTETPVDTPSDTVETTVETVEETPAEPVVETPEAPETPVEESLYELPDGRKVDAVTLQKEWKENFLPDYTRKSQRLAEVERRPAEEPEWKRPDYQPKSYDEIIEKGAELALQRIAEQQAAVEKQQKEVATQVDQQIADLKKVDPKLDENALFQHANKYGFRDLGMAHTNMVALREAALTAEQRALKNVRARNETPVGATPGATPVDTGAIDPNISSKFGSALEYFQSLK